jgi:hypothetical protein
MAQIPFVDAQGQSAYLPKNFYFSPKKIYGRDALVKRPGLTLFCDLGTDLPVRGLYATDKELYAVSGYHLFKVDSFGNATEIGDFLEPFSDMTWMAHNGEQLMVLDGGVLYCYGPDISAGNKGGNTFFKVKEINFKIASLAYQGGHFLGHAESTQFFYESTPLDGTTWNELDYAITVVKPDDLLGVYEVNGDVFAIGRQCGEVYYNSGNASFSYSKTPGGNIPIGTNAPKSVSVFLGSLIMLASDRTIVQAAVTPQKLSNVHVDRLIADLGTVSDAVGAVLSFEGHSFYCITFPSGNKTLVYDFTTQMWYDWSMGKYRWRPQCFCRFMDKNYAGDYENGKIYLIDQHAYSDNGEEIIVEHVVPIIKDNLMATFNLFEIEMETGTGLSTGQGSDPKVMFAYSTDKGATWSYERTASIGRIGDRRGRVQFRRLGRHYAFTAKISISDPIRVVIIGAYLNDKLR